MKTLMKTGIAFGFMVAFLESVVATANWWRGDGLAWWEWSLVGALPILIGIYLRYFSVFACGRGQCLTRPDEPKPPAA